MDSIIKFEKSPEFSDFENSAVELRLLHFKIKGILLLRLERFEACLAVFCESEKVFCDAEINSYCAQSLIQLRRFDEALLASQRAFSLGGSNPIVVGTYIMTRIITGRESDLSETLDWDDPILYSEMVSTAAGHAFACKRDYETALYFYERSYDLDSENPNLIFALCCTKFLLIQTQTLYGWSAEHHDDEFHQLVSLLEKARELFRAFDFAIYDERCLQVLAAITFLQGKYADSLRYLDFCFSEEALESCVESKFHCLMRLCRFEDAEELANSLCSSNHRLYLRFSYLLAKERLDLGLARSLMERLLNLDEPDDTSRIFDLDEYAHLLNSLGAPELADLAILELEEKYSTVSHALVLLVRFCRVYRPERDVQPFIESSILTSDARRLIHVATANLFARELRWLSSCDELLQLPTLREEPTLLFNLTYCQVQGGLSLAASRNCKSLRGIYPELSPKFIKETEFDFYVKTGDWSAAIEVCNFLIERYPGFLIFKILKAVVLCRSQSGYAEAISILRPHSLDDIPGWALGYLRPILPFLKSD